jgi:hypothetical protein
MPVVMYGCETWLLTLMKERRLKVFENRVLWKTFRHKRDDDPLKGSKHVAWLKYTNCKSIFSIVVFDRYPSSYLRGMRWWRKLHNEELHDPYFSPYIVRAIKSRRMRWTRHERRCLYRVLVGNPEGKRPLVTPRSRWEDNIKMISEQ